MIKVNIQWDNGIPKKVNAGLHEDNGSSTDAECPTKMICCYLTELMFKAVF